MRSGKQNEAKETYFPGWTKERSISFLVSWTLSSPLALIFIRYLIPLLACNLPKLKTKSNLTETDIRTVSRINPLRFFWKRRLTALLIARTQFLRLSNMKRGNKFKVLSFLSFFFFFFFQKFIFKTMNSYLPRNKKKDYSSFYLYLCSSC